MYKHIQVILHCILHLHVAMKNVANIWTTIDELLKDFTQLQCYEMNEHQHHRWLNLMTIIYEVNIIFGQ